MGQFIMTIGVCLLMTVSPLWSQDCNQPYGKWKNENGSVLEIFERNEEGQLSGRYRSHEGTEGQTFSVIGWWPEGDTVAVSFSVFWKPYGTLTSWTGMCKDDSVELMWHHVDPKPRFEFQQWSTQKSVFHPMNSKEGEE